MVKIRIGTTISFLVNLFLSFWLVNQYLNDIYFQNYVNASIGPYSPFIVLTIGLGGGSGFGYMLLKRRHGDQGLIGKIQKSKSFRPGSLLSTGTPTASPSRQILPLARRHPQDQSTRSTLSRHYLRVQLPAAQ